MEEESAKALLEQLIPRMTPDGVTIHTRFVVFEGKQDLLKNLERKLRGYLHSTASFFVLRDQDRDDCVLVKKRLRSICIKAGRRNSVVRIACRELEAFYLGDLKAVEAGLGIKGLSRKQMAAKFRDPDRLQNPSLELERLTGFAYQRVAGSRAIGEHLSLDDSRSRSYLQFVRSITAAINS